jgi:outer membrane protein assembly factor BamD (BamD/ComL family)
MAASCTLQAARASLDAGRNQEAEQLLSAVVHTYPESEYAFYVRQAKIWMKDLPDADLNSERTPASNL